MIRRRTLAGTALVAALATGAAALPGFAPAAGTTHPPAHHKKAGKTREVGINSDYYDPDKLTIHVGDKVKWVWHSSGFALHDVYVDSGPSDFHSPTQATGTYSHTFTKPGVYKLYCTQHEADMTMTLTVRKVPR